MLMFADVEAQPTGEQLGGSRVSQTIKVLARCLTTDDGRIEFANSDGCSSLHLPSRTNCFDAGPWPWP